MPCEWFPSKCFHTWRLLKWMGAFQHGVLTATTPIWCHSAQTNEVCMHACNKLLNFSRQARKTMLATPYSIKELKDHFLWNLNFLCIALQPIILSNYLSWVIISVQPCHDLTNFFRLLSSVSAMGLLENENGHTWHYKDIIYVCMIHKKSFI